MYQDYDSVTFDRRGVRARGESKTAALTRAHRAGTLSTSKKFGAGENRSAHSAVGGKSMAKIEAETDAKPIARVDHSLKVALQKARQAKGMTQKDLAARIAEKQSLVNDYESGRAIPNPGVLNKMERALGVRLPRPGKKRKAAPKK